VCNSCWESCLFFFTWDSVILNLFSGERVSLFSCSSFSFQIKRVKCVHVLRLSSKKVWCTWRRVSLRFLSR
jgi:hypothetical protein